MGFRITEGKAAVVSAVCLVRPHRRKTLREMRSRARRTLRDLPLSMGDLTGTKRRNRWGWMTTGIIGLLGVDQIDPNVLDHRFHLPRTDELEHVHARGGERAPEQITLGHNVEASPPVQQGKAVLRIHDEEFAKRRIREDNLSVDKMRWSGTNGADKQRRQQDSLDHDGILSSQLSQPSRLYFE
jgi:hypothetical protein